MKKHTISLNGTWFADYLSRDTYLDTVEPQYTIPDVYSDAESYVTPVSVPGYFEDQMDTFRATPLHTKLEYNPLYTLQRYPQTGYVPDMALPNPVGCFIYARRFELEAIPEGECELYFGGVQNTVAVWINGEYIGRHEGYSAPFTLTVRCGLLKVGGNTVTLTVSNNRLKGYKGRPVSGLTSRAANECTGGIYGNVELRFYTDGIKDAWVSTAPDLATFTVKCDGNCRTGATVDIFDGSRTVKSAKIPIGESQVTFTTEGMDFWSPDSAKLYTARITSGCTTLSVRFGIRRLARVERGLTLNGKPYFFKGTCEHCYHPITVHPTNDKYYYRRVVRTLKELGFNSIRFHTYVPMAEYMEAADELGMVIEVETPNNTTEAEWREIVKFCRHYTCVCAYSSGNEMVIDEDYIEHLRACAAFVHGESDSLFSPMSAMRGIEYHSYGDHRVDTPFPHNPKRLSALDEFCDLYNTYSLGSTSYESETGTAEILDKRNAVYKRPLLSHEICIHGTYIDLALKDRYRGSRIGDTEFMTSVERHLEKMGLIENAPTYYRTSSAWQRILRKHCFETVRRSESFAGYDFLGDIDTHWHTFGYCVGMMNEFYELKPGETVENVLRYNGDTVLLADLPHLVNFNSGEKLTVPIHVSNYGEPLEKAVLRIRLATRDGVLIRKEIRVSDVKPGRITHLYDLDITMPKVNAPAELKLHVSLDGGNTDCDNVWELYVYPKPQAKLPSAKILEKAGITVCSGMSLEELTRKMEMGERVVIFGGEPFNTVSTTFQLSIAGRTMGHLATVINDHPLTEALPHDGFCSWQFRGMMSNARAAVLDITSMPHRPIIDIATSYKNAHREALLFEYSVGKGKLIVCTLNLDDSDRGAAWLKSAIVDYAMSDRFEPKDKISAAELVEICSSKVLENGVNVNAAQNKNDITML